MKEDLPPPPLVLPEEISLEYSYEELSASTHLGAFRFGSGIVWLEVLQVS